MVFFYPIAIELYELDFPALVSVFGAADAAAALSDISGGALGSHSTSEAVTGTTNNEPCLRRMLELYVPSGNFIFAKANAE